MDLRGLYQLAGSDEDRIERASVEAQPVKPKLPDEIQSIIVDACITESLDPKEALELIVSDPHYMQHPEQVTPEFVKGLVNSISDRKAREQGQVPKGWGGIGYCRACGPIWVPTGLEGINAMGCPWCHQRTLGLTVPRPAYS